MDISNFANYYIQQKQKIFSNDDLTFNSVILEIDLKNNLKKIKVNDLSINHKHFNFYADEIDFDIGEKLLININEIDLQVEENKNKLDINYLRDYFEENQDYFLRDIYNFLLAKREKKVSNFVLDLHNAKINFKEKDYVFSEVKINKFNNDLWAKYKFLNLSFLIKSNLEFKNEKLFLDGYSSVSRQNNNELNNIFIENDFLKVYKKIFYNKSYFNLEYSKDNIAFNFKAIFEDLDQISLLKDEKIKENISYFELSSNIEFENKFTSNYKLKLNNSEISGELIYLNEADEYNLSIEISADYDEILATDIQNLKISSNIINRNSNLYLNDIKINDANLSLKGNLELQNHKKLFGTLEVDSKLTVENVVDYWPIILASTQREWVKESILYGDLQDTIIKFTGDDFKINFDLFDGNVNYLENYPPVYVKSSSSELDKFSYRATIKKGTLNKTIIDGSNLVVPFDEKISKNIEYKIFAKGDIKNILEYLYLPGIDIRDEVNIDENLVNGKFTSTINLAHPPKPKEEIEQIIFSGKGEMHIDDIIYDKPYFLNLRDVKTNITFDNNEVVVKGKTNWLDSDAEFSYKRDIKNDKSDLRLSFDLNDKFGTYINFPIRTNIADKIRLDVSIKNNSQQLEQVNIKSQIKNKLYFFKSILSLEPDDESFVNFNLKREKENELVGNLSAKLKDTNVNLDIVTDNNFKLKNIKTNDFEISEFIKGKVNAEINDNKINIDLDLDHLYKDKFFEIVKDHLFKKSIFEQVDINLNIKELFLKSNTINDLKFKYLFQDKKITQLELDANGKSIINLEKDENENYVLNGYHFADLLLIFNENSKIEGGSFKVTNINKSGFKIESKENIENENEKDIIIIDNVDLLNKKNKDELLNNIKFADDIIRSEVVIDDFTIKFSSFLNKLFVAGSFDGLSNLLTNNGIIITYAKFKFYFHNDILYIEEGRIEGPSVGMSFLGTVNLNDENVNIFGSISPFHIFNAITSNVPLLGDIVNSRQGEGFVSLAYHIKTNDEKEVEISVNPLSLITPGFFRRIFDKEIDIDEKLTPENEDETSPQNNVSKEAEDNETVKITEKEEDNEVSIHENNDNKIEKENSSDAEKKR